MSIDPMTYHGDDMDALDALGGVIYGRKPTYQQWGGGPNARILKDALVEILRLRGLLEEVHENIHAVDTEGNEVVFSCPSCGTPSAKTVEPHLDIHAGATYTCCECSGRVIFEVLTPEEYTGRSMDAARARAEGRLEGLQEAFDSVYITAYNGAELSTWSAGRKAALLAVNKMIASALRDREGGSE